MEPAVHGPRIVLGIDYGTTYTGLGWTQIDAHGVPKLDELNIFENWPRGNNPKVPSAYSYSSASAERQCRQWGYDIDDNSEVMRWTKLELKPRATVKELEVLRELLEGLNLINNLRKDNNAASMSEIPRHLPKDAGDIVRDYLTEVAREWYLYMRSKGKSTLESVPLDVVIAHPASWPYEAINKTFRAAMGAFHKGMFPTRRNIFLTSEPEACALYTVQDMLLRDQNTLIPGECFVLCDAGGGTVDAVAYRTENTNPLILTRIGGVSGGYYGATFIDHAFMEWLRPRLKNQNLLPRDFQLGGHFVLTPTVRILLTRFERVKRTFSGTEGGDFSLPRGAFIAEDQEEGLDSGVIDLTNQHIRVMFERSVRGTVNLIERQITQTENRVDGGPPCKVTNVLLGGGFSENEYLFREVKRYTDSRQIKLQRANDCWGGVAKGAVLRGVGIGMDAPTMVKPCPRNYGVCISEIYADWRQNNAQAVTDVFQRQVVPNQLIWLIRKGDVILPHEPIVSTLGAECRFNTRNLDSGAAMRIIFVACTSDSPPSNLSNLPRDRNEVVDIDIDLKKIPSSSRYRSTHSHGGHTYYTANVSIELEVSSDVKVKFKCGGVILGNYDTRL